MPPKKKPTDNTAMRELKRALRDGSLKNLYLFHGEEAFLREYYLGQLKQVLLPPVWRISISTPPRERIARWTGLSRRWTACP